MATATSSTSPSKLASRFRGEINLAGQSFSLATLNLLPQKIAAQYRVVVFSDQEDRRTHERVLSMATANPNDPDIEKLVEGLESHNNVKVEIYQASEDELDTQLSRYLSESGEKGGDATQPTAGEVEDVTTPEALQSVINSSQIPNIVTALLSFGVYKKASDIHVEPLEESVRVRFRIDGVLTSIATVPRYFRNALISRIKIMSQMKIDEQRVPQDGRFTYDYHNHSIDVRVSTLPTVNGEKVVMRLLDQDSGIMTLEQLGLTGRTFDAVIKAIERPFGVILATGPTGSGKSTTLYAILNRIAKSSTNVVTLEDPVEYQIPGINQSQVKPEIGFTFAEGLRSVLRQDPNIIMVGEVRDLETASMVTHAALTGHLVLSTLHTNDAPGALPRLIDMGVEPFLITSAMNLVIAQRLVRKLCVACRRQVDLPEGVMEEIRSELSELKNFPMADQTKLTFYEAVGCSQCTNGYTGRIGVYEVIPMTPTIESLVNSRQPASVIAEAAKKEGMISMRQDGIIKALQGITTINEVWEATTE